MKYNIGHAVQKQCLASFKLGTEIFNGAFDDRLGLIGGTWRWSVGVVSSSHQILELFPLAANTYDRFSSSATSKRQRR